MASVFHRRLWFFWFITLFFIGLTIVLFSRLPIMNPKVVQLLTDPFLQLPTETSVRVVWFTEFPGLQHVVTYGEDQKVVATTTQLSRTREDQKSRVGEQTEDQQIYQQPTQRPIWRHEAEVTQLTPGQRVPYRVMSVREDGESVSSDQFTLTPKPLPGKPLKILLTSDHQLMPMTPANLQKVAETIGVDQLDAIFMAGDLVNIPDRASEWFDDNRGGAFFPSLQGRAHRELEKNGVKTVYRGGQLIQHLPLFPAIGNHEVMGRFSMQSSLGDQFNDAFPREVAQQFYAQKAEQLNPSNDLKIQSAWLKDHSFNTDTYEEIFSLPENSPGGKKYYAVTFGDVRLVVLYITNIWRRPQLDEVPKGRFRERTEDLQNSAEWGYGQHIFEPIVKGSVQYGWLAQELNSSEFKQAKYKIVMFHHPPHSLGDNIVPAYTNPVQLIDRDAKGQITGVRYEYPKQADYIIRDVIPLLDAAGVQLVFYGHSHLWNRFESPSGLHFLETSNVGNTYGAYMGNQKRPVPAGYKEEYAAIEDPNGLQPVMPTIAPLKDQDGQLMPYVASNDLTVFSILDTATGTVSSYRFDIREPDSQVVKFDQFQLFTIFNREVINRSIHFSK